MALVAQSLHDIPNLDGTVDDRYPLGDKPFIQPSTLGINLTAFNAANISLLKIPQNQLQDYNYRQYLTGSSAATASLSVNSVNGALGLWTIDAALNGPTNSGIQAGNGTISVQATDGVTTVSFPSQPWSILAPAQQTVKNWNPGDYLASNGQLAKGGGLSNFSTDLSRITHSPLCVGYRSFVTPAHFDVGPVTFTASAGGATFTTLTAALPTGFANGTYTFRFSNGNLRDCTVAGLAVNWSGALSAGTVTTANVYFFGVTDQIFNQLKTGLARPCHWVWSLQPETFGGGQINTTTGSGYFPLYILQNSAYGLSPVGGSFGWWGPPAGVTTYASAMAIWRTAVAARVALEYVEVLTRYGNDPYFEGIMLQETSATVSPAVNTSPKASDYSDSAFVAALKTIYTAALNLNVKAQLGIQNTWLQASQATQDLQVWMIANGVVTCETDGAGASKCAARPKVFASWGLQAYAGITADNANGVGLKDYRGIAPCWVDYEAPDLGAYGFGTRFFNGTPQDSFNGASFYKPTHRFWTSLDSNSSAPTACLYPNLDPLFAVNEGTAAGVLRAYPTNAPGY